MDKKNYSNDQKTYDNNKIDSSNDILGRFENLTVHNKDRVEVGSNGIPRVGNNDTNKNHYKQSKDKEYKKKAIEAEESNDSIKLFKFLNKPKQSRFITDSQSDLESGNYSSNKSNFNESNISNENRNNASNKEESILYNPLPQQFEELKINKSQLNSLFYKENAGRLSNNDNLTEESNKRTNQYNLSSQSQNPILSYDRLNSNMITDIGNKFSSVISNNNANYIANNKITSNKTKNINHFNNNNNNPINTNYSNDYYTINNVHHNINNNNNTSIPINDRNLSSNIIYNNYKNTINSNSATSINPSPHNFISNHPNIQYENYNGKNNTIYSIQPLPNNNCSQLIYQNQQVNSIYPIYQSNTAPYSQLPLENCGINNQVPYYNNYTNNISYNLSNNSNIQSKPYQNFIDPRINQLNNQSYTIKSSPTVVLSNINNNFDLIQQQRLIAYNNNFNNTNTSNSSANIYYNNLNDINTLSSNNYNRIINSNPNINHMNINQINNNFNNPKIKNLKIQDNNNQYSSYLINPSNSNMTQIHNLSEKPDSQSNSKNEENNYINSEININADESLEKMVAALKEIVKKRETEFSDYIQSKVGSKNLQTICCSLFSNHTKIPDFFIDKLLNSNIFSIILSKYGSFFFEKFAKLLSYEQRMKIMSSNFFMKNFVNMCCGKYSNMVIQSFIKNMVNRKSEEKYFISLFNGNLDLLAANQYANFTLNQLFYCFSVKNKQFIIDHINKNLVDLSTNSQYGHYLVKNYIKYLDYATQQSIVITNSNFDTKENENELETQRHTFLKYTIKQLFFLVPNRYGHFVIVDLVDIWGVEYCRELVNLYAENIEIFWRVVYGYAIAKRIFLFNTENAVSCITFNINYY